MAIVSIIILVLASVIFILTFNKLVKASNMNSEAFSNVDTALKKRYDLIPNLENIVKGYTSHEKNTLEDIAKIRSNLSNKMTVDERQKAEDKYSSVIKDVFVSVENYPELKASENFLEFQKALVKIEEDIEMARRYYNGTTRNYNILVEQFPTNILAKLFGFEKRSYFEVDLLTRENVKVDL
ncbi:MAG: LemA family protein [Clostridia bacterium]|nr:LemA family protein [Clostridia bacterium]